MHADTEPSGRDMGVLKLGRSGPSRAADHSGHHDTAAGDPLADLLRRSGRGDTRAFAALYDELAGLVHGVVVKVVRDPSQSEEVTQEVFVELWRLAARFDDRRGTVRGWAATVAHRRAIDRVRSEQSARDRVQREVVNVMIDHDEVADEVMSDLGGELDRARVRRALERLTPLQREAIELAYYSGHTYREVASLLGVAEGTVKTRIRDGMIRLRDELGEGS